VAGGHKGGEEGRVCERKFPSKKCRVFYIIIAKKLLVARNQNPGWGLNQCPGIEDIKCMGGVVENLAGVQLPQPPHQVAPCVLRFY